MKARNMSRLVGRHRFVIQLLFKKVSPIYDLTRSLSRVILPCKLE